MRNVVLCGFMGCGKTTVGRQLAALSGRRFVDMDEYIEQQAGMAVSEIFRQYGEDDFRRRERETCRALFEAATTDACLDLLDAAGLRAPVLESLLAAVQLHLDRRAAGAFRVGAILFSNQHGPLGQTETAAQILNDWKER